MASQLHVQLGDRSYPIRVERNGSSAFLQEMILDKRILLVADSNTASLFAEKYMEKLTAAETVTISVFPAGERSKHLSTVEPICRDAVKAGLDRSSVFIALGGGVCGDMTGLAASLYMRGTRFIQIPTTLLAMVDSSVGGKTGVDLPEGKNLIGTFFQPQAVWIDPDNLSSLPAKQLSNGFAELVKTAMILDAGLFDTLEQNAVSLFSLADHSPMEQVIIRSCELKASVVSRDEKEQGLRAILNYGHTFGHALEAVTHYNRFEHGEAVAIGMGMAADLAVQLGFLRVEDALRQDALLRAFGLPTHVRSMGLKADELLAAMYHDKKTSGGKLKLVLCNAVGKASVYDSIPDSDIRNAIGGRI